MGLDDFFRSVFSPEPAPIAAPRGRARYYRQMAPYAASEAPRKVRHARGSKPKVEAITGHNSGENWSAVDINAAIENAARETNLKYPKVLHAVAHAESLLDSAADGRDGNHHIVSRGLMQIRPQTLFEDILAPPQSRNELQRLLSQPQYGDRFKPVLDYMNGDRSKATHDAVIRKMYDPQFSAYAGAIFLRQMGANVNPAQAYLNYVSPAMGPLIAQEAKAGSYKTALQIAAEHGIASEVVTNNPAVYGPGGDYTAQQVIAHNNTKFGHVMPKPQTVLAKRKRATHHRMLRRSSLPHQNITY